MTQASCEAILRGMENEIPSICEDKVEIWLGDENDPGCATFVIRDEDHTLANALRYIVLKNPLVSYCGYSIPHPSDPKVHFRIQTDSDLSAVEILTKGLTDLMDICMTVNSKFEDALENDDYQVVTGEKP